MQTEKRINPRPLSQAPLRSQWRELHPYRLWVLGRIRGTCHLRRAASALRTAAQIDDVHGVLAGDKPPHQHRHREALHDDRERHDAEGGDEDVIVERSANASASASAPRRPPP